MRRLPAPAASSSSALLVAHAGSTPTPVATSLAASSVEPQLRVRTDLTEAVFARGYAGLKAGRSVVLGLSPGNGFFTREMVGAMTRFCLARFEHVIVFVPGASAAHNFMAIGRPAARARARARWDEMRLRRHVLHAVSDDAAALQRVTFVDWERHALRQAAYHDALGAVHDMLAASANFQRDLKHSIVDPIQSLARASNVILTAHVTGTTDSAVTPMPPRTQVPGGPIGAVSLESALHIAQHYVIEEFAWLLAAPFILPHMQPLQPMHAAQLHGANGSAARAGPPAAVPVVPVVYHKRWPLFENFAHGLYAKAGAGGSVPGAGSGRKRIVTAPDVHRIAFLVVEPVHGPATTAPGGTVAGAAVGAELGVAL